MRLQEDGRREEEEAERRARAVSARQALEDQMRGNARLRELARVCALTCLSVVRSGAALLPHSWFPAQCTRTTGCERTESRVELWNSLGSN